MIQGFTIVPKAWELQPNETPKQFSAFKCYLTMGEKRSCAAVGRALGKSAGLIERWCSRNAWRDRVAAFEAHVTAMATEAELNTLMLANIDWAKRAAEQREKEWRDAQALRAKAAEILANKNLKGTVIDAVRALSVASELERRAMNLPTANVEHAGAMAISNSTVLVNFPDNHRDKPNPPESVTTASHAKPQIAAAPANTAEVEQGRRD
jgi:hypothetical protein